jgi:hypothetical protein
LQFYPETNSGNPAGPATTKPLACWLLLAQESTIIKKRSFISIFLINNHLASAIKKITAFMVRRKKETLSLLTLLYKLTDQKYGHSGT